jgi:acetyltransferase-like isoleucine patch superfamily enzyme
MATSLERDFPMVLKIFDRYREKLPGLDGYEVIGLVPDRIAYIHERHGISISAEGSNNWLVIRQDGPPLQGRPSILVRGSDNLIVIETPTAFSGTVHMGSGNVCVLRGHQHALALEVNMYDRSTLIWGRASSTYRTRIWMHGEKRLIVGDDCLFSENIMMHTSDHHSIIDLASMQQTNFPAEVIIADHVWIGPNVTILPGVTIGLGAIISSGSVVTKAVGATELWGGSPARLLRQNVSWVTSHPAVREEIDALKMILAARTQ